MGLGGISMWQLLIILLIVVMIFGTKRLKNIGSDLGGAIKGFKKSMDEDSPENADKKKKSRANQMKRQRQLRAQKKKRTIINSQLLLTILP